jgi:hypothetical protein
MLSEVSQIQKDKDLMSSPCVQLYPFNFKMCKVLDVLKCMGEVKCKS